MENNVTIDATNVRHLTDFFNELSSNDQKKVFLEAFRKTSKPLVVRVKSNAPIGKTKNLFRSIGTMQVPGEIAILVGAKKGGGSKGWVGHLIENGTSQRFRRTKTGTASTGRIIGTHFFENAYGNTDEELEKNTEKEFYLAIDNMIVRVNKKASK